MMSVSLLSIVRSVEMPDEKKIEFLSSNYLTWISPKSYLSQKTDDKTSEKKKMISQILFLKQVFMKHDIMTFLKP